MSEYRSYPAPAHQPKRRARHPRRRWAVLAFLLAATAVLVGALALAGAPGLRSTYDESSSTPHTASGETEAAMQERLDRTARESALWISVAQSVRADAGSRELYAVERIDESGRAVLLPVLDNVEANGLDMRYTIALEDTGETIYESGLIAPGQSIEHPTLSRALDPGTYRAVATGQGFDRKTHEARGGGVATKIIIAVDAESSA